MILCLLITGCSTVQERSHSRQTIQVAEFSKWNHYTQLKGFELTGMGSGCYNGYDCVFSYEIGDIKPNMDTFMFGYACYKTPNKKNKFVLLARTYNTLQPKTDVVLTFNNGIKTLTLNGIVEMNGSKAVFEFTDQIYEMINSKKTTVTLKNAITQTIVINNTMVDLHLHQKQFIDCTQDTFNNSTEEQ